MSLDRTSAWRDSKILSDSKNLCKVSCYKSCTYCKRAATKERHKSGYCPMSQIKIYERCCLCRSLEFCPTRNKCSNCCSRSTCRGKTTPVLGNLGTLGAGSNSVKILGRLLSPLPYPAKSEKVTHHRKVLCQSSQEPLPDGGIACTYDKKIAVNWSKIRNLWGF